MLSHEDFLDLEEEAYRLKGISNLLELWAGNNGGYEACYISEGLNDIVKNINKILQINDL